MIQLEVAPGPSPSQPEIMIRVSESAAGRTWLARPGPGPVSSTSPGLPVTVSKRPPVTGPRPGRPRHGHCCLINLSLSPSLSLSPPRSQTVVTVTVTVTVTAHEHAHEPKGPLLGSRFVGHGPLRDRTAARDVDGRTAEGHTHRDHHTGQRTAECRKEPGKRYTPPEDE